jgi:hypothetical protein
MSPVQWTEVVKTDFCKAGPSPPQQRRIIVGFGEEDEEDEVGLERVGLVGLR